MKRDARMLSELRMLGAGLPIGTSTHAELCPNCRGGTSSERSFSVTRLDALRLAYCCHRATCGYHGIVGGTPGSYSETPVRDTRPDQGRRYTAETVGLAEGWLLELGSKYGFSPDEINRLGWTQEARTGRLVVRVRGPDGKERGVHTRARAGHPGVPKTRDFGRGSEAWMGWFACDGPRFDEKPVVVLVEDVISAAKVWTAGFISASLMGSSLSLEQLLEAISVAKGGTIVLALDRDASDKAIAYVLRYRFLIPGTFVTLLLSKDLKYHTKEEIQKMVNEVVTP